MEVYKLLYIDDEIDPLLSEYLDKKLPFSIKKKDVILECTELPFVPTDGFRSLLSDGRVLSANIILIDSRLFEDRNAEEGKFSGEEFKIILKKYYPFIDVIVITQNGADEAMGTLPKYNPESGKQVDDFYDSILPNYIDKAIEQNRVFRNLANRLNQNSSWEPLLKEKVLATLEGTENYDDLTKTDIDELVVAFRDILESLNE